jgi:hypothetical protein
MTLEVKIAVTDLWGKKKKDRKNHGLMKKNDTWISVFNHYLYNTYNETETVKLMTAGSLMWLYAERRSKTVQEDNVP